MSLPRFHSNDQTLQLMQSQWASQLNPLLDNPLSSGIILSNVALVVGDNVISHKLGRKLQGWIVIGKSAASEIYDTQASNQMPEKTLNLNSQNACVVSLYVF